MSTSTVLTSTSSTRTGRFPLHPWGPEQTGKRLAAVQGMVADPPTLEVICLLRAEFRQHLQDFVDACNFGRRLKILKGLTPYKSICNAGHQNQTASSSIQSIKCQD